MLNSTLVLGVCSGLLGEIAGHGADVELVFPCAIHQGFLPLDALLIVLGELGAIP